MPTLVACLWQRVEAIQPCRVPTHFGPATRLGRPKSPRNQGALATSQVEMCPRTANSGKGKAASAEPEPAAEETAPPTPTEPELPIAQEPEPVSAEPEMPVPPKRRGRPPKVRS